MVDAIATYMLINNVHGSSDEDEQLPDAAKRLPEDGFSLPEKDFVKLFRLKKCTARKLCEELRPALQPISEVQSALTVERKVLCALRFYGTGAYQQNLAQDCYVLMSQQSVSACITAVTKAIGDCLLAQYISFPAASEYPSLQEKFRLLGGSRHGFPGVIGAIDCTHISIEAPSQFDEHYPEAIYVNRKMTHSINVQLVCDADMRILNINSRFPGSAHDAYIWRSSSLRERLYSETPARNPHGWLLGDSGYPLEPWLMTPFPRPQTLAQRRYNLSHSRTRVVVERCNGVLKSRFRCLSRLRALKYHPSMAARITVACAVLHNMCLGDGVSFDEEPPIPSDDHPIEPADPDEEIISARQRKLVSKNIRQRLVNTYFN